VEKVLEPAQGKSTPVGLKKSKPDTLYGNYTQYCDEEGVNICSPSRFKEDLMNYLKTIPQFSECRMCERNLGIVVTNLVLSKKQLGSSTDSSEDLNPLSHSTVDSLGSGMRSADLYRYDEKNREDYLNYISLKNHPEYEKLKSLSKFLIPDGKLQELYNTRLSKVDQLTVSQGFKDRVLDRLKKDALKINQFGLAVTTYSIMGASPRLQPIDPRAGSSFISLSSSIRTYAFLHYKNLLDKHYGGTGLILDLDLVSCYMNLVVSLYPLEASELKKLINKGL